MDRSGSVGAAGCFSSIDWSDSGDGMESLSVEHNSNINYFINDILYKRYGAREKKTFQGLGSQSVKILCLCVSVSVNNKTCLNSSQVDL